jgi:formate dehydrogenase gamma subunit
MSQKNYLRFALAQRIEHWVLVLSFTTLALTGLPQKYATVGIAQAFITLLGGIETVRIIHRIAATTFLMESVYHAVVLGYKLYVMRVEASMVPKVKDIQDAIAAFGYNLGIAKKPPKMPRYNFTEKAEYWAMLWGLIMMGLTGFMLWNPILTVRVLPGEFIPAAKAAHGAEAVLAVLAIIVWHFYNVHLKSWNWGMIKGTLTRHQMEEEHGEELEKIEAGKIAAPTVVTPQVLRKRRQIYIPVAAVISFGLIFGIYWLTTAERTAILTVPPPEENVAVISMATATPMPTASVAAAPADNNGGAAAATTWDGGVGALFGSKCAMCHGASGGLALDSYANAMTGGSQGAVIVAGNPEKSPLVAVQQSGSHPGTFSSDELQQVIDWIKAGAPEK